MTTDWVEVAIAAAIGLGTLFFGYNYRRQLKLNLADKRLSAYAELWTETGLAAPTRLMGGPRGALSKRDRSVLHQRLTDWYYRKGNGMLLESRTRNIYLAAKHNLICQNKELRPPMLCRLIESFPSEAAEGQEPEEQRRGCLSIRQLSLLRSQLKADLAIYGVTYVNRLKDHEVAFLLECSVRLWRRPWRYAVPLRYLLLGKLATHLPWRIKERETCREGPEQPG